LQRREIMKKKFDVRYVGMGIILGSAVGSALSMIITGNPINGVFGTGLGIVFGAIVASVKAR